MFQVHCENFQPQFWTADSREGSDGALSPLQCLALQASSWPGSPRVACCPAVPLPVAEIWHHCPEWVFDLIFLGTRKTRRLELPLIRTWVLPLDSLCSSSGPPAGDQCLLEDFGLSCLFSPLSPWGHLPETDGLLLFSDPWTEAWSSADHLPTLAFYKSFILFTFVLQDTPLSTLFSTHHTPEAFWLNHYNIDGKCDHPYL